MGFYSRVQSILGLEDPRVLTLVASQTTLRLPKGSNNFEITSPATETIATIDALGRISGGRVVIFVAKIGSAAVTFTNNNATTTKGQMELGGSNIVLDDNDVLVLWQRPDGTWIRITNTNN